MRFGADFYPFSRVPALSLGPALFWSLPLWITMCREDEDDEECDDPDDMVPENLDDDLPFILYFGIMGKWMF